MASLQKIRNHGPLLIIVVGLAMLAFILGDVLTNVGHLRNNDIPNVGSVAGNKVSIEDFGQLKLNVENLAKSNPVWAISMWGNQQQQAECDQLVSQFQELQKQEGNEQELSKIYNRIQSIANAIDLNAATWNVFVRYYTQKSQADAMGMDISPEEEAEIANGLPEKLTKGEYLQQKYTSLLQSTFHPSPIEAEFAINSRQQSTTAEYVMVPYEAIDATYSEADVQALYDQYKAGFRGEQYRTIAFAVLNYIPSENDFEKEAEDMDALYKEFCTTSNIEDLLDNASDEGFREVQEYTEATVPAEFKEFAFGKDAKVDSCSAIVRDAQAFSFARIVSQDKAKKTVALAIVRHTVYPSDGSKMDMNAQFNQILGSVESIDDLNQALREATGMFTQQVTVQRFDQTIDNIQGTRKVITWAFGAYTGNVCKEVFEIGDQMVIAAVVEASNGQYAPAGNQYVKAFLEPIASQNAKAAYVAGKLPSVKSLDEVAAVFGQEVKSGVATVTLADNSFAGNNEPAVVGAAFAQKANGEITPIQGKMGVYYIKPGVVTNTGAEITDEAKNTEMGNQYGILSQKFRQAAQLLYLNTENSIYDLERF